MKKIFKWIGILLGIFLLFIILAVIALITLVDPNRFKPMITQHISAMTGRTLTIEGDLAWSVFPNFGLKVNQLVLHNPPQFKQKNFAEIKNATVMVKLFPLLKRKVESSGITLDGLKLYLIKDAKGNDNWHLIPVKIQDQVASSSMEKRLEKAPLLIAIAGIHVSNAAIFWLDEQKSQSIAIKNLEFHAKNINLLNPFPITGHFDYQNGPSQGKITFQSHLALDMNAQVFAFKNISLNVDQEKYRFHLQGDVTADFKRETLQWTHFQGSMGKLQIVGQISGKNILNAPQFKGHFSLKPLDMREWLKTSGFNIENLQVFNPLSGDFDLNANNQDLHLNGKLLAKTLQTNRVQVSNLSLPMVYQNGVLTISPIQGDFYRGRLNGAIKMAGMQIAIEASLEHFEAALLLKDLVGDQSKLKFSGTGNIQALVTTNIQENSLKSLNGKGQFGFENGVMQGIDMTSLINSAYSVIKKTPLSTNNTGQTDFGKMTGTFIIQNGIVKNTDLLLVAPQFTANGQGIIDLPNNAINYHLKTLLNKANIADKDTILNLYGVAIPILISGNLQNPKVGLDGAEVAKLLADMQVKKVEMHIKDKLKGKKASELLNNLFGH